MSHVNKATFIGVGAQKCASSWIYDVLSDHPMVSVSEKKELDFFSYNYERGLEWYGDQFDFCRPVRGEISPSYFHDPAVPSRVRKYNPDIRVIVSLRDPVERALSQHRHLVRLGFVSDRLLDFEAAVSQNPTYLEQGYYARHLEQWLACFNRESIHIVFMEEIASDPMEVAARVYDFVGADASHQSAFLHQKSNPSYVVRNRALDAAVRFARRGVRRIGLGAAWSGLARTPLRALYRSYNRVESARAIPSPSVDFLRSLRREFEGDVLRLQELTGTDLAAWLPDGRGHEAGHC